MPERGERTVYDEANKAQNQVEHHVAEASLLPVGHDRGDDDENTRNGIDRYGEEF